MSGTSSSPSSERPSRRTRLQVERVWPHHVIPGGRLDIAGRGFQVDEAARLRVFLGDRSAHIQRVSSTRLAVRVPEDAGEDLRVCLGSRETEPYPVTVGQPIAEKLHIVSNPVFDREGNLYSTVSGRRGEEIADPIYRFPPGDGEPEPLGEGILNPTGLAWGPDDTLYVSSREDGCVYRMDDQSRFQVFSQNLGCPTGICFAPTGDLVVGDRGGTLYLATAEGDVSVLSPMRPSISAYHLAYNSAGCLFVSGPTLSARDQIVEFQPEGTPSRIHTGFGRPQGIAFNEYDQFLVAEGLAGDSGVFMFTGSGVRRIISGPPVVGLALNGQGDFIVATSDRLFHFFADADLMGIPEETEGA